MGEFNIEDFESTGNIAVDMVINCVGYHRTNKSPIKEIYLNDFYWQKFEGWIRQRMGSDEQDLPAIFEMDGVPVSHNPIDTGNILDVEMY